MYIDAVHYAPHGLINVQELDCDFLVCSPYKFFGPHMGTLYGKRQHLQRIRPYKVRPCTDQVPERWETGTQVQELIAGIGAAVEYIAGVGRHIDPASNASRSLKTAYAAPVAYELAYWPVLSKGCRPFPPYASTASRIRTIRERCSTLSFRLGNHHPTEIAAFLGDRGIFTWDGNYYALNLPNAWAWNTQGGLLRIGLVHYNTLEEVDRLLSALREFAVR